MSSKHIAALLWGVVGLVICLFVNVKIDIILRYMAGGVAFGYLVMFLEDYFDKKLPVWEARLEEKIQQSKNKSKK